MFATPPRIVDFPSCRSSGTVKQSFDTKTEMACLEVNHLSTGWLRKLKELCFTLIDGASVNPCDAAAEHIGREQCIKLSWRGIYFCGGGNGVISSWGLVPGTSLSLSQTLLQPIPKTGCLQGQHSIHTMKIQRTGNSILSTRRQAHDTRA